MVTLIEPRTVSSAVDPIPLVYTKLCQFGLCCVLTLPSPEFLIEPSTGCLLLPEAGPTTWLVGVIIASGTWQVAWIIRLVTALGCMHPLNWVTS